MRRPGPSRTVLIVDDDDAVREALAEALERAGHAVVQARNGLEALDRARAARPCVIILDLMMPVTSGWEFRERQLADPAIADVPVVVVSGTLHGLEPLGASAVLAKPVAPLRLLETIRRVAPTC